LHRGIRFDLLKQPISDPFNVVRVFRPAKAYVITNGPSDCKLKQFAAILLPSPRGRDWGRGKPSISPSATTSQPWVAQPHPGATADHL